MYTKTYCIVNNTVVSTRRGDAEGQGTVPLERRTPGGTYDDVAKSGRMARARAAGRGPHGGCIRGPGPRPAEGAEDRRARRHERAGGLLGARRSEEHTSELQSPCNLVCRLLLEKKKKQKY